MTYTHSDYTHVSYDIWSAINNHFPNILIIYGTCIHIHTFNTQHTLTQDQSTKQPLTLLANVTFIRNIQHAHHIFHSQTIIPERRWVIYKSSSTTYVFFSCIILHKNDTLLTLYNNYIFRLRQKWRHFLSIIYIDFFFLAK